MKRSGKKLILIIVALIIAVFAASFGVFKLYENRAASSVGESSVASGQTDDDSAGDSRDGGRSEDGTKEPLATIFFASDYQAEAGFDEPSETLRKILAAARADGKEIDRVVMCGDYTNDSRLHDYQLSPDGAIEEVREIVSGECFGDETEKADNTDTRVENGKEGDAGARDDGDEGNIEEGGNGSDSDKVMFVQGNHDKMTAQITPTGIYDCGDYLIYILNTEEDFPWKQGKTAGALAKVRRSAAAMKECFDGLIESGETRPVFIAGHVPLHFTARTSSKHTTGDNLYSSLIFDVVNEAAKSLDIVYLFGHDHSKGWDCYLGGSSVYRAAGDTILIPEFEESSVNTDTYIEETLNFTYLNAGYAGYYMNCAPDEYIAGSDEYSAADETLTGTVLEVFEGRIVITRYDAAGAHVLGHDGEADPYKGGIDAGLIPEDKYSEETQSPQTVERKR